ELLAAAGASRSAAPEADDATLALVASPWNPALRALLVSGAGDAALACAVDALTLPEPAALLTGAAAVLTEPVSATAEEGPARAFTFRRLGQAERTVEGTLAGTTTVTFVATAAAEHAHGEPELLVSTPTTLEPHSNLGVELNGTLVQTLALERGGVRAPYRVQLPATLLQPGPNSLRVRTTLYPERASPTPARSRRASACGRYCTTTPRSPSRMTATSGPGADRWRPCPTRSPAAAACGTRRSSSTRRAPPPSARASTRRRNSGARAAAPPSSMRCRRPKPPPSGSASATSCSPASTPAARSRARSSARCRSCCTPTARASSSKATRGSVAC
ncbi:MAG: hypothetical protein FJ035_07700, partial [Chloroflexi bacterium]|nr:hypothetical protein [Chloroflexota bacterium]